MTSQRTHFTDLESASSGDEDKLVIDERPQKARKAAIRNKRVHAISASDDEDEVVPSTSSGIKKPKVEPKKRQYKSPAKPSASSKPISLLLDHNEQRWQKAMDVAMSIFVPLKVDTKDLTMLPDTPTLECFKKASQSFLNEKKIFLAPTFSTHKSIVTIIARFVMDFVLRTSGILSPQGLNLGDNTISWSASGCAIWKHGYDGNNLSCLHGLPMINKETIVEMDVTSENAQRALKENPEKAKITTNRWGRGIVQIKNEDAVCCVHDATALPNSFSAKSCGMAFTEAQKAMQAFRQIMAYQSACYPKMANASSHMLIPLKCDCNWQMQSSPMLGRQICKMTPFNVNSTSSVDKDLIDDPKILATLNNPSIWVFQCCNPVYRSTKANPQKNCDFKLSSTDLVSALQIAKQIWLAYQSSSPPVAIQEFKWNPSYQFQHTILPTSQEDDDDSLF